MVVVVARVGTVGAGEVLTVNDGTACSMTLVVGGPPVVVVVVVEVVVAPVVGVVETKAWVVQSQRKP